MADNSWMLPPKLRYKQRKFGTKEAEMLMMCNHRSQEAELERRYQRLNVALQDFLRKYRHEVWEVRHFLRNIGRIETQNRLGLLPTEKYKEEIFNAKLRAHNLRKKKRQEQQAEEPPYTYDTDDEMTYTRLNDMMDRSLSLTASTHTRTKSSATFDDHEDNSDSILPEVSKRSSRKGSAVSNKLRKKPSDAGKKASSTTPSTSVRRTPTGLDPIMENGRPPLKTKANQKILHRTLSEVSYQGENVDFNPVENPKGITSVYDDEDNNAVHLPKIYTRIIQH